MTPLINYENKSNNTIAKLIFIVLQIFIIYTSYLLLSGKFPAPFYKYLGTTANKVHLFPVAYNFLIFVFYTPSILFFVKRKIVIQEIIGVSFAFGAYYLLYPLIYLLDPQYNFICIVAGSILLFSGLSLHLISEYQRHKFKQKNPGSLYTQGLWKYSRHINYFADIVWASGYALSLCSPFAFIIPVLLFIFFYFFNIPQLESHLSAKYTSQFSVYKKNTKSLIPFIL
jgi:protein-S-isoprenylcysteine O-methyltransferase Ste14